MSKSGVDRRKQLVPTNGALPRPDSASHQEWLIDEALKETFPASDPISPALSSATPRATATPSCGQAHGDHRQTDERRNQQERQDDTRRDQQDRAAGSV